MAKLKVNPQRFDPYRNFEFRVKWAGRHVAGFSKVSGLARTTEVMKHREGGDPSSGGKTPGRAKFDAITLERGVTHDSEFGDWAGKVWRLAARARSKAPPRDSRKDVVIELYDEAGRLAAVYNVFQCWVSEFQGLPALDANANAIEIEHIKLENEGWERDAGPDRK